MKSLALLHGAIIHKAQSTTLLAIALTEDYFAVAVDSGEEMDKDLWMLVEELRDQNRNLIEELRASHKGGPAATPAL